MASHHLTTNWLLAY